MSEMIERVARALAAAARNHHEDPPLHLINVSYINAAAEEGSDGKED